MAVNVRPKVSLSHPRQLDKLSGRTRCWSPPPGLLAPKRLLAPLPSCPAVHIFDPGEIVMHGAETVLEQRVYEVSRLETRLGLANLQDQRPRTIIESSRSAERCRVETLQSQPTLALPADGERVSCIGRSVTAALRPHSSPRWCFPGGSRSPRPFLRISYGFGVPILRASYENASERPQTQANRPTPIPCVFGGFRPPSLAFAKP